MRTAKTVFGMLLLLGAAGCATPTAEPQPADAPQAPLEETSTGYTVHELGEYFDTADGHCKVIRVQDDYRLIRCVTAGRIQGCFEDLLTVPRLDLELMTWREVDALDGLEVAFLTPDRVAIRQDRLQRPLHGHDPDHDTAPEPFPIQPHRRGNPASFAQADRK